MKKLRLLFASMLTLLFLTNTSVFAQVPPEQDVIVIEGGAANIGLLESTINEDIDENGNRINPNRVYLLKKNTVYFQASAINFGGETDSTATLNIIGEEDGKMPIILMQPLSGVTHFENHVHGSLTIKNVYWPNINLINNGGALFKMHRGGITVRVENFVTENSFGYAPFHFRGVLGIMNFYLKNCYFRDNTQFANSWNYGIYARGDNGEPFDTLWVENVTIANCGMPLFGKFNPVNFFFFDHNTVINSCKYPIWHEQLKEAYVTNNLFINANYEGECQSTANTQMSADGTFNGLINLHPIDDNWWVDPPAMEDVIFLAANNLSHRSPFFNDYYTGQYNSVGDKPISNRAWGDITDDMLPILVENVPLEMFNELTLGIIDQYPGYKAAHNHDMDLDPEMVTKGMATQEKTNEFVKFMRNNYGVADASETFDRSMMYFGDMDPQTVPGVEVESGEGIYKISDFVEDFTYNADVRSTIDGKPIGALSWWDMEYDGEESLEWIRGYYVDPDNWVIPSRVDEVNTLELFSIYPNPAKDLLQINSTFNLKNASMYDVCGKLVTQYDLNGVLNKTINISQLNNGLYFIKIETIEGKSNVQKFIKE